MRRLTVALCWAAIVAVAALPTFARLGGGEGFSGGGSRGGGGSGDDAFGALIEFALWMVFRHPKLGIPLLILAVLIAVVSKRAGFTWSTDSNATVLRSPPPVAGSAFSRRVRLGPLRSADANFSEPLFVDFAQLVYARAQELRGAGRPEPLAPWLAPEALALLFRDREGLTEVRQIIFGATRIVEARVDVSWTTLQVDYTTNLTEVRAAAHRPLLCDERWAFRRRTGVLSPGPDRMRALGCPGCGSTLEPKRDGTCPNCSGPRARGFAQWEVATILFARRRPLEPPELRRGGGTEPGTERRTIVDPDLAARRRAFEARHPDHAWDAFRRRIESVFQRLQKAWSEQAWELARPFETDALFQVHRFWIERYRAFGLKNVLADVGIQRLELVKIDLDAFYESITVRVHARMRDWIEDQDGNVVGGSRDEPRSFSEYWTFIRSVGAPDRSAWNAASCPSCGAPADKVNMAGVCDYCGSKITTGRFDWVLSRIEQDDVYTG